MVMDKITLYIHEIIDRAKKARTKEKKLNILKENENWALKDILGGIYSDDIKFNLPPGTPPYTEANEGKFPSDLRRKHKDFRYFVIGGPGDKLNSVKRETMFIGLLEAIHPKDAELVVQMINKQKVDGITKNVVMEAFPTLPIK